MSVSEAQKRATSKYESRNYDKILIRLKKGQRERYKRRAEEKGYSLNAYIIHLIEKDINDEAKSKLFVKHKTEV